MKRQSIAPTYDSRETGPRYHVTAKVDHRVVGTFQAPAEDPFVRQTVTVGWRDLLRGLRRRSLVVEVLVGGDPGIIEDVLELNADYLGANCTRRDEFNSGVSEAVRSA